MGKLLQLGYPGGPVIEQKAKKGNSEYIRFPRAYLDEGSLDFSFSGLKTAVLNHVRSIGAKKTKDNVANFLKDILRANKVAIEIMKGQ